MNAIMSLNKGGNVMLTYEVITLAFPKHSDILSEERVIKRGGKL